MKENSEITALAVETDPEHLLCFFWGKIVDSGDDDDNSMPHDLCSLQQHFGLSEAVRYNMQSTGI